MDDETGSINSFRLALLAGPVAARYGVVPRMEKDSMLLHHALAACAIERAKDSTGTPPTIPAGILPRHVACDNASRREYRVALLHEYPPSKLLAFYTMPSKKLTIANAAAAPSARRKLESESGRSPRK